MAQTALTIVGYAVGTYFGYPQLGAIIGAYVGGQYEIANTEIHGARLNDLKTPSFEYGAAIPRLWGGCRFPGHIVWMSSKREIATTTGGKGGAEPEVTTYTYEVDVLYLLVDNEIAGVPRIWKNGELIYSAHAESDPGTWGASASSEEWTDLRVYTGTDDQLPDPVYESAVGAGRAPAYRGRGTVFIEGLQLGQSGQMPVLTFEVLTAASAEPTCAEAEARPHLAWDLVEEGGAGEVYALANDTQLTINVIDGNIFPLSSTVATRGRTNRGVGGCKRYFEFSWVTYRSTSSAINSCALLIHDMGSGAYVGLDSGGAIVEDSVGDDIVDSFYPGSSIAYQMPGNILAPITRLGIALDTDTGAFWLWYQGWHGMTSDAHPETGVGGYISSLPAAATDLRIEYVQRGGDYSVDVFIHTTADEFALDVPDGFIPWSSDSADIDVLTPGTVYLDDVVRDICVAAGLTDDQIDVTDLAAVEVKGVPITQVSPGRATLEALATSYFFECVESDKLYFRRRGGASVATITVDEMGASAGDPNAEDPIGFARGNDLEIPARIALQYINADDDYQAGAEQSDRLVGDSVESRALVAPVVFEPSQAKGIADALVLDGRVSSMSFKPAIDSTRPEIEPTDVVILVDEDGTSYRARIVRETLSEMVRAFECVLDDASVLVSAGITDESAEPSFSVRKASSTEWMLLDIPILRDVDDAPGIYVAVRAAGPKWPGTVVYSSDDNTVFEEEAVGTRQATFGRVTVALDDWEGGNVFDELSSVTVDVDDGTLFSYTREEVLAGTTPAYLVGDEIIAARTATMLSAGVYTLTGLLRGRRGTEWAMSGHTLLDRFVVLQDQGILRAETAPTAIGEERYWKAVTPTRSLSSVPSEAFVDTGIALKPFSVQDIRANRESSQLVLTWKRRSRLAYRLLADAVPLGEDTEAYDVELYDDADVLVSTDRVTAPTWTYAPEIAVVEKRFDGYAVAAVADADSYFAYRPFSSSRAYKLSSAGAIESQSAVLGSLIKRMVVSDGDLFVLAEYIAPGDTLPSERTVVRFAGGDLSTISSDYTTSVFGEYFTDMVSDGTSIFVSTGEGTLLRLDHTTLALLDTYSISAPARLNAMAFDGVGSIYLAYGNFSGGTLEKWDIATEVATWSEPCIADPGETGIEYYSGMAVVGSSEAIAAYDETDGSEVYQATDSDGFDVGGFAIAGGMIYATLYTFVGGARSDYLGSFDATTGDQIQKSAISLSMLEVTMLGDELWVGDTNYLLNAEPDLTGYSATIYQISASVGRGYPASINL